MTVAEESFVLCDTGVNGCAIRFASREFADLFGYEASECVKKTYGALVGCHSIVGSGKQGLFALAASTGLPISVVEKGFKVLMSSVKQLYARIQQDPELCGRTLQLHRKKDGTVFVCELRMEIKTRFSVQSPYCLAVQNDVSESVSISKLLQAAADGVYEALAESFGVAKDQVFAFQTEDEMRFLDDTASAMWGCALRENVAKSNRGDQRLSKLVESQTTSCGSSEWSEMGVSAVGSWTRSFSPLPDDSFTRGSSTLGPQISERSRDLLEDAEIDFNEDGPIDIGMSFPFQRW
eukprot:CAMPEP_0194497754 /NCGR_PEP_ID=MMETSP0253-20130528/14603_1 /TAXON_ID=2966 /ORGANISM="Noctiluca scintillans" /LENGTH=292 /DNA_ID=CAMNT_0039339297 /DNA_START=15 /DNA_END=890 /DNA_ORIENTATION=+